MHVVNYLIWYLAIVIDSFYNIDYNRTHKLSIDNNEYGQLDYPIWYQAIIGVARIGAEPVAKNKCWAIMWSISVEQ